ncbi:flippase [Lactobacillus crispatus]|uniref:flippase n=1 Tax=Lactobacillus crispatus TaxID=47770 RepID=UPI001958FF66|nr:flippase [Lactobacillus crispatus]MBM6872085.1 flippase [Lactobacillus crispatus]
MKKKSLSVNAFLNGLRSVLNLIFPLITFPYVSRVLSVEGIGIFNFSNIYVGYFLLIAGLGVATYAVREGAKYRDNKELLSKFASQVFTINIYSTIIAYVLLLLSLIIFKSLHTYVLAILIFSLQIVFTTVGTEWVYTIYEDYSYITIRSIAFKIISILLLFIFVRKSNDYLWYVAVSVFATVGSNILNFLHVKQFCDLRLVRETKWQYHLKPILIIFASSLAVTIYVSSDTTILGLIKNDYAVGIYSVSVKIYQLAQNLLAALLMVTIPRLAMLFGKRKYQEYKVVLGKVLNTLSLLVLPASVGLIMLSRDVVLVIAGPKYLESVNSLRIITWATIFSIFSWIFSDCVLIPAKREMMVLKNTIITAVINVLLNFVLIPLFSYDGTSLSTVLAELLVMILNGYSCWDIVKPVICRKETLKNIFSSIIGCIGIVIICLICDFGWESIIGRIVGSIILSVIIYGAILISLNNQIALEALTQVKKRFLNK